MGECVEGEWKNFVFKLVRPSDFSRVVEHLRKNFYTHEPLYRLAGYEDCTDEDWLLEDLLILDALEQKLGFFVVELETNKVAGVRIGTVHRRGRKSSGSNLQSRQLSKIFPFSQKLLKQSRIYEEFRVDYYVDFFITSVGKEFLGEGLAFEMYKRSIEMVKKQGFTLIAGCFSNPYTRKIAARQGFEELTREYMREYQDSNGNCVFPSAQANEFLSVMALKL